jgi:hypothetical protein
VLTRIFGPKRNEMAEGWRKLHNEELRNLYSSPDTVRMFEAKRIIQEEYVLRAGRRRIHVRFWWVSQKE